MLLITSAVLDAYPQFELSKTQCKNVEPFEWAVQSNWLVEVKFWLQLNRDKLD